MIFQKGILEKEDEAIVHHIILPVMQHGCLVSNR